MRFTLVLLILALFASAICQQVSHNLINLDNFQPQQLSALLSGDWRKLLQTASSKFAGHMSQYQPPQHQSLENIFKRHFMAMNKDLLQRHKLSL